MNCQVWTVVLHLQGQSCEISGGDGHQARTALDLCLYPLTSSLGLYLCCDSPAERGGDRLLITVAYTEEKLKGHAAARLAKGSLARGGQQGKGMWWRAGDFVLSWEGVSHQN